MSNVTSHIILWRGSGRPISALADTLRGVLRSAEPTPTDVTEAYVWLDEQVAEQDGTWAEVDAARLDGRLTDDEYRALSVALDGAA